MGLIIRTRYTWWHELELKKALEFTHCSPIVEHVDCRPKKSCLFLLGDKGILTVPYKENYEEDII